MILAFFELNIKLRNSQNFVKYFQFSFCKTFNFLFQNQLFTIVFKFYVIRFYCTFQNNDLPKSITYSTLLLVYLFSS